MTTEKRTPLFPLHVQHNARMVPFAGYEMPLQYESVLKEHHTVRERAGIFDASHMGELEFQGSGAASFVDSLVTGSIQGLKPGQGRYTLACNAQGGIRDDLIVYRLREDVVLVVCNASNREKIWEHFSGQLAGQCEARDRTEELALLALQGPASVATLRACGAHDAVLKLERFGVCESEIGPHRCVVARTGYTGEDGVEIFCPAEAAPDLFAQLLDRGAPFGVKPAGLGCRDTLRLEAALSLYGHEITEETNPFEAGLRWVVDLEKGSFVGREALIPLAAEKPSRRLVGLEMTGRGTARADYPVVVNGTPVGHVTSGSVAPTLGRHIALAYVSSEYARIGTNVVVSIPNRDRIIEARVVKKPFYRRAQTATNQQ